MHYPAPMPNLNAQFTDALHTALQLAETHLNNLAASPVAATTDLPTLRHRLAKQFRSESLPPAQVISELAADVAGGILGTAGGRFFGWVIGGSLPAALAADWLTSTWDQNAPLHSCSPAAAIVEEVSGQWLKEILGIPASASFAFVSGCQMAHVTCLAAARHALLASSGWNVEEQGLSGSSSIRILAGDQRHGALDRAMRLLGLGSSQLTALPTDDRGRMRPSALESELQRDSSSPTIVLLQAGDIHTGAFDPFCDLIPLAKAHKAWVHIDGAFGLWAAGSPQYKHLVDGVEQADSWATDGHKWLNVPFDSGFAFVAHPEAHRAAMSHRAPYLTFNAEARDQIDWNPEWSRRARGFPTYAALRQLGREGIADLIDRCCSHARALVARIGSLPGAEIVAEPVLNQGLVRFPYPNSNAAESAHARRTDEIISAINATGEAFFTGSNWKGGRVMRISVCNWQTTTSDVDRAVSAAALVLQQAKTEYAELP
jgi:glutamate/tyrosine decarboxylase-like PLP-dependent enzyme